jgi:type IV pilus assembly protein PilM
MSIVRRIFPSDADAVRPRLAVEILPFHVLAARPGDVAVAGESQDVVTAVAPLRLGTVSPGLKAANLKDRAAVSAAIQQALDQVTNAGGRGGNRAGGRSKKVTVIVPDAAVRVLLLDFDTLPSKAADVLPILRFRLRKLVPFEVDDAAISYQVLDTQRQAGSDNLVRVAVAVMPSAIREEYEDAVREAGYEPGSVLSSSLAALAALPNDGAVLLVNRNANSVTTAISKANDLLLFRTLDFPEPTPDAILDEGIDRHIGEDLITEELQQAVSVSVAYYEDMLQTPVTQIYSVGPGGAAELTRLLADDTLSVRELVPSPPGTGQSETTGMLAGVVGALAS